MGLSRRDLLKAGLFGSAALVLPAERVARTELAVRNRIPHGELPAPFTVPFARPEVLAPVHRTADTDFYIVTQRQTTAQIIPGLHTTVWGYNGLVPGPTIEARQGRQTIVRQICDLPAVHPSLRYEVWSSTHLHGSCSLPQYDGYASDVTLPGQYKDYVYPNTQDARTIWYHDHGVHITATNAAMGLAAFYIIHDENELALPIPHGAYDVPLVLRDAMFTQDGELVLDDNDHSGMYGDVNLVNGRPWPLMHVEPRRYRFRLLNAAVSRSYDLRLSTGDPLTVIATDGGLMPHPQEVANLRFAMAERYEVVIDFSKYTPGTRVVLENVSPPNNIDYENTDVVMAFEVGAHVSDRSNNEVPRDLNPNQAIMGLTEKDAVRTRHIDFGRTDGEWTINGTTWADVVASDYEFTIANPGFDDVEIWELQNESGGWFHPVHIHLVDFKVLDRNGRPPLPHELGPKDVVYVGEREIVRVIMRFDHRGKYMIHCHNLVHEDHDMMAQFEVGHGGDDPMKADPARDLPAGPLFVEEDRGSEPVAESTPSPTPVASPTPAAPTQSAGRRRKSRGKGAARRVRRTAERKPTPRKPKRSKGGDPEAAKGRSRKPKPARRRRKR